MNMLITIIMDVYAEQKEKGSELLEPSNQQFLNEFMASVVSKKNLDRMSAVIEELEGEEEEEELDDMAQLKKLVLDLTIANAETQKALSEIKSAVGAGGLSRKASFKKEHEPVENRERKWL